MPRQDYLYPYQERDLQIIFNKLSEIKKGERILYQLPTGGGKTRIFSEIAKWFVGRFNQKVLILTHRIELCGQTSASLKKLEVRHKIIDSSVKHLNKENNRSCYVAMVETLRNRINEGMLDPSTIGLIIVDEAHHNSFQKLLNRFPEAYVIGVTATPLSSDVHSPMHRTYGELLVGESIESLIKQGYLAKPSNWRYDVELNSLKTGTHGDFTISTSDALYSSPAMLELLLHAYEAHSRNKKTLIFNNGIFTSRAVCKYFEDAGYAIRHLDNHTSAAERNEILKWFKRTRSAILTSVSILTTGFDEPTIQTVILNRATTSLTLYHQMIGRGSRRLPNKKTFGIIDLGNNTERFGDWQKQLDWQLIFKHPDVFSESLHNNSGELNHQIPSDLRAKFPNTLQLSFDVQQAYQQAVDEGKKSINVIRDAIRQHAIMCMENSETVEEALNLCNDLDREIAWRVKQYGKCLGHVTRNYTEWLENDYRDRLKTLVKRLKARELNSNKAKKAAA